MPRYIVFEVYRESLRPTGSSVIVEADSPSAAYSEARRQMNWSGELNAFCLLKGEGDYEAWERLTYSDQNGFYRFRTSAK